MLPNPEIREVTIKDYLEIIRKHLKLIIALLVIIPTVVTIYVYTKKPIYRSTVSLLIELGQIRVAKFEDVVDTASSRGRMLVEYYKTQYKIISSYSLAERVYEDLKLSKDPEFAKLSKPVAALQARVSVEPLKESNVVLLHIEDPDSLRAATIANAYGKAYIQQDIDIRNRTVREARGWLESQLEDIKKRMRTSEEVLSKYLQENKIIETTDIDKKKEGIIESLKGEKAKIEAELANAAKRYKAKHPKMISLNAQLEQVDAKIGKETEILLALNEKMIQYNFLKKEAEANQQVYSSILTRAKETGLSDVESSTIRIIDSAKPSEFPFKPKKRQSILMAILFSLFSGIGLAVLLEYLDSSIRTAEDVSNYLNLPFLGYIPSINIQDGKNESEKALICYQKTTNPTIESYRALRTSILFSSPEDKPLKTILITSSLPGEGKSFIATNLASIFSQVNERVVLIDVDMRRPKLYKLFNIDQKPGLSAFLTGNVSLEEIIRMTPFNNLSIITSGAIPPNPSELLSSGKIRALLEDLKLKFDRIIIDSPPALNVADTHLLASNVDGVVLVVKGASTRFEAVVGAKNKILESKGKLIGAVVNNINPVKEDRYYYYQYYYTEDKDKVKHKKT
jgi:tyrosine-protein kinase Etk/Wzc